MITLNQLLLEKRDLHLLYLYNDEKEYFRQVLTFIEEGIAAGEQVIIVENDKITAGLLRDLNRRHSASDLDVVHFVNSLYFYRSSGSYSPPAIIEFFLETIQPYVDKDVLFRSWAHVEWSSNEEPHHIVKECETACEEIISEYAFPHVCAYGKKRISAELAELLVSVHSYVIAEEDLAISQQDSR
ncbi:MEDS domain-containing protein [Sporosarcina sp. SAFN-015]|uniref:MEDS domain-containing protein n=1 Tax=Sporosarcina sp. SAFN-015 TaxID=3387274 RepID=UPI003F7E9BA2